MPSNIEIKAVLRDRVAALATAALLSGKPPQIIAQEDFFFACQGARLKLRVLSPERGELIRYERPDVEGTRCSHYQIARTTDPDVLLEILTRILGRTGTVRKKRVLSIIGQTRVHIDEVEGLGDFLELEVVLQPEQSEADGERIAEKLLADFGIDRSQLVAGAYVDLLAAKVEK